MRAVALATKRVVPATNAPGREKIQIAGLAGTFRMKTASFRRKQDGRTGWHATHERKHMLEHVLGSPWQPVTRIVHLMTSLTVVVTTASLDLTKEEEKRGGSAIVLETDPRPVHQGRKHPSLHCNVALFECHIANPQHDLSCHGQCSVTPFRQ